jgi:hypothetical protein
MFHTYVPSVLSGCCVCFTIVFKCFCKCFRCMFQVCHLLQTYVASVASECFKSRWVLHLAPRFLLPRLSFSSSSSRRLGISRPLPLFSTLVAFGAVRPCIATRNRTGNKLQVRASGSPVRLDIRALASPRIKFKILSFYRTKNVSLLQD